MTGVLDAVARHAHERPRAVALRARAGASWTETTWLDLYRSACRVAGRAADLPRHGPVVLAMDTSADAVSVLVGMLLANRDVICVERDSSHLHDDGSVLRRITTAAVVAPESPTDGTLAPERVALRYADLLSGPERGAPPVAMPGPGHGPAPAGGHVYQLTSGSTGEPRIVRHPRRALDRGATIYRDLFGYRDTDRVLLPIPATHSFGMVGGLAASLLAGATLDLLGAFSLRGVHEAVAAGATLMLGTPLVYRLVGDAPKPTAPRLRLALSSGGPLGAPTRSAAEAALGTRIRDVYGSTETGIVAYQPPAGPRLPEGSTGVAAPGVSWRIADGALLVRTSTVFTGYLEPGGLVPNDAAGEYHTGDLGHLDESGVLWLTGRKASFINVGGRKVNPDRVSRILRGHAEVRDAHVYGLDGSLGEQAVHAAVVATGCGVTELARYCRARLAPHEVPRLHVVSRLPRSALGKVDLAALLADLRTEGRTSP